MPIDLTTKLIPTIGKIALKNADGSPMLDDANQPAYVRLHSPASKVWQVADAAKRRKAMKRVRENGGKIEAAADGDEDVIEFLVAVTEDFVNVSVPLAEGETGAKAMVRAIYSNPALGYIRDQAEAAASDWGSFTDGSVTA
jgi:hypothetical protein